MQTRTDRARIYSLKRRYGQAIVLRTIASTSANVETGVIDTKITTLPVRRAIVLKGSKLSRFIYDLAYIAANKNFTYGADFTQQGITIIVDASDIPDYFDHKISGEVLIRDITYKYKQMNYDELSSAYVIAAVTGGRGS